MLDCYGDHAVCCPCGPLRIQRHNALTDELADITVETGAHVRREAWIREFANETSDAYLDIWAFGSTDVVDLLIDVTIRHPMSAAYQPAASSLRGARQQQASRARGQGIQPLTDAPLPHLQLKLGVGSATMQRVCYNASSLQPRVVKLSEGTRAFLAAL